MTVLHLHISSWKTMQHSRMLDFLEHASVYSHIWNFITNISDKEIKSKYIFQGLHNNIYYTLQKIPVYPLLLSHHNFQGFPNITYYFMGCVPFLCINNERKERKARDAWLLSHYSMHLRDHKDKCSYWKCSNSDNFRMTALFRWEKTSKIIEPNCKPSTAKPTTKTCPKNIVLVASMMTSGGSARCYPHYSKEGSVGPEHGKSSEIVNSSTAWLQFSERASTHCWNRWWQWQWWLYLH